MYYLLVGRRPYGGMKKREAFGELLANRPPYLPPRIAASEDPAIGAVLEAIGRCRAYDAERRPSAREVAEALDAAVMKMRP